MKPVFREKWHEIFVPKKVKGENWRMKRKLRTLSVVIVLCLNIGIDPPDSIKSTTVQTQLTWIDPLSLQHSPSQVIGRRLKKQYQKHQPRARYKLCLDPTIDNVKKECMGMRRSCKKDRLLFHYNGLGVPHVSDTELWFFNRNFTRYVPISIYNLHSWIKSPAVYVFDCAKAGKVIHQLRKIFQIEEKRNPRIKDNIIFGACGAKETLPNNPDLPGDLFTSCLTTPIRTSLRWYAINHYFIHDFPWRKIEMMIQQEERTIVHRRTYLGELTWIFTSITESIAWSVLPRSLFHRLFRQDLLVASLFRAYLLANRIMRKTNCTPISHPQIPDTQHHPLWKTWDLALDHFVSEIRNKEISKILIQNSPKFSPFSLPAEANIDETNRGRFFNTQLREFEVWLEITKGDSKKKRMRNPMSTILREYKDVDLKERGNLTPTSLLGIGLYAHPSTMEVVPPPHLPILLQVISSTDFRLDTLRLLVQYFRRGWREVNLALSVGVYSNLLKLVERTHQTKEFFNRPLKLVLVELWLHILAFEKSGKKELVSKMGRGYMYFVKILLMRNYLEDDEEKELLKSRGRSPVVVGSGGRTPKPSVRSKSVLKKPLPHHILNNRVVFEDRVRTMACFVLSHVFYKFNEGQTDCAKRNQKIFPYLRHTLYPDVHKSRNPYSSSITSSQDGSTNQKTIWHILLLSQLIYRNRENQYMAMKSRLHNILLTYLRRPSTYSSSNVNEGKKSKKQQDMEDQQTRKNLILNPEMRATIIYALSCFADIRRRPEKKSEFVLGEEIEIARTMFEEVMDGSPFVRKEVLFFLIRYLIAYLGCVPKENIRKLLIKAHVSVPDSVKSPSKKKKNNNKKKKKKKDNKKKKSKNKRKDMRKRYKKREAEDSEDSSSSEDDDDDDDEDEGEEDDFEDFEGLDNKRPEDEKKRKLKIHLRTFGMDILRSFEMFLMDPCVEISTLAYRVLHVVRDFLFDPNYISNFNVEDEFERATRDGVEDSKSVSESVFSPSSIEGVPSIYSFTDDDPHHIDDEEIPLHGEWKSKEDSHMGGKFPLHPHQQYHPLQQQQQQQQHQVHRPQMRLHPGRNQPVVTNQPTTIGGIGNGSADWMKRRNEPTSAIQHVALPRHQQQLQQQLQQQQQQQNNERFRKTQQPRHFDPRRRRRDPTINNPTQTRQQQLPPVKKRTMSGGGMRKISSDEGIKAKTSNIRNDFKNRNKPRGQLETVRTGRRQVRSRERYFKGQANQNVGARRPQNFRNNMAAKVGNRAPVTPEDKENNNMFKGNADRRKEQKQQILQQQRRVQKQIQPHGFAPPFAEKSIRRSPAHPSLSSSDGRGAGLDPLVWQLGRGRPTAPSSLPLDKLDSSPRVKIVSEEKRKRNKFFKQLPKSYIFQYNVERFLRPSKPPSQKAVRRILHHQMLQNKLENEGQQLHQGEIVAMKKRTKTKKDLKMSGSSSSDQDDPYDQLQQEVKCFGGDRGESHNLGQLKFHSKKSILLSRSLEGNQITLWNWRKQKKITSFKQSWDSSESKITSSGGSDRDSSSSLDISRKFFFRPPQSLGVSGYGFVSDFEIINEKFEDELLVVASCGGNAVVYKDYESDSKRKRVSSLIVCPDANPEFSPFGIGVKIEWIQQSGTLIAGGDVVDSGSVKMWDMNKEYCVNSLDFGPGYTGFNSPALVTCFVKDPMGGRSLVGVGLASRKSGLSPPCMGWMDLRANQVVQVLKSPSSQILGGSVVIGGSSGKGGRNSKKKGVRDPKNSHYVNAYMVKSNPYMVLSCDFYGRIEIWDMRNTVKILRVVNNRVKNFECSDFKVHPFAPLCALSCPKARVVQVYNYLRNQMVGNIAYYDSLLGRRIGQISCIAFHPYRRILAAASNIITVYK